jgi:hypothetical protein
MIEGLSSSWRNITLTSDETILQTQSTTFGVLALASYNSASEPEYYFERQAI